MIAFVISVVAAYGVHLIYTAAVFDWQGLGPGPRRQSARRTSVDRRKWLDEAGLTDVSRLQFCAVLLTMATLGGLIGFAVFGGALPALAAAAFTGGLPLATYRARRLARHARAQEAWPVMIDELRIFTGAVGLSVPQALFEVGRRAPDELRPGFEAAHREWLLSTDFSRTLTVLKRHLADATCDAACETLLVAHEVGGADLERRLAALADDRLQEVQGRKDARARQAGARFARRFVLLVPLGMAFAGLSVGTGRHAYQTAQGQFAVLTGIVTVVACWIWAGRIMRVPDELRVFSR